MAASMVGALVLIHGRGADEYDLQPLAEKPHGARGGNAFETVADGEIDPLALEIFENEFYKAVLGTSANAGANAAFATAVPSGTCSASSPYFFR